ncbi:hypothetical protein Tco_0919142 [Tanacetum coccineum]
MEDDYNWPELEEISNLFEALLQEEKELSMASEAEDKRRSLVDEISKLFSASLARSLGFIRCYKMVDTWAPKLPAERVLVKYPSLVEEIHTGLFRRSVIAETLVRMLSHSKVDATMNPTIEKDSLDSHLDILQKWFSIEERSGGDLVIGVEDKPPFILAKKDLNHLYNDLEALRYGFTEENADWIVCVAPVRQQEYIETCITAAKLENWTPTDRKWQWGQDGLRRIVSSTMAKFEHVFCLLRGPPEDANVAWVQMLLVVRMTCVLMVSGNHNLVCILQKTLDWPNCTFTSWEILFVCLLITRAKIHRITHGYRKDIDELMKALEVIVEINEQSERALELHLLEFTEVKPVAESTLLLYVATRVVMDRCFILLGLMPNDRHVPFGLHQLRIRLREQDFRKTGKFDKKTKSGKKKIMKKGIPKLERELLGRCIAPSFVSVAREPFRNSRFEVFSIRSFITKVPKFESGKMFGSISISDKYGSIPDGGSHIFEPDFAYVPLFDHEWFHSIDMHNREYICLGNPSSPNSVAFSSSVEINMEIYVTDKEKKACFEVGCTKMELDLLDIWSRNLGSKCGLVTAKGEDGYTEMYYMLIKDAVDARVEIRYRVGRGPGKVRAEIYAYYGSDILDRCLDTKRPCYWALLFRADEIALEELGEKIPLRKAVMAVPKGAPLKILAHLYDIESDEVILDGICELSSLTEGRSKGAIEGSGCSLSLRVEWKYC